MHTPTDTGITPPGIKAFICQCFHAMFILLLPEAFVCEVCFRSDLMLLQVESLREACEDIQLIGCLLPACQSYPTASTHLELL